MNELLSSIKNLLAFPVKFTLNYVKKETQRDLQISNLEKSISKIENNFDLEKRVVRVEALISKDLEARIIKLETEIRVARLNSVKNLLKGLSKNDYQG